MAYMKNSRLPVYWVIKVAQGYGMDKEKVEAHWPNHPRGWVQAAFHYYETYPKEIDEQIALYETSSSFDSLKRRLPQVEVFPVPQSVLDGE